jgi:hypothetical protein
MPLQTIAFELSDPFACAHGMTPNSPTHYTFRASCHCHASALSVTIPRSSLPLPTHFCHCGICRHTHGTLFSVHAPIPAPNVDLGTFTEYRSSAEVVKWFCSGCGSHLLDRVGGCGDDEKDGDGKDMWFVATALVEIEEDKLDFTGHQFVGSTVDGGLATLLTHINSKHLPLWNERPVYASTIPFEDWQPVSRPETEIADGGAKLRARCHCGGIECWIARPTPGEERDKNLQTKDERKWCGAHSASTSDRLTSSSPITSWVYLPIASLTTSASSPSSPHPGSIENLFGPALKSYTSSRGVTRTFCGTCGASVSYEHQARPGVVGVAAGLLEAGGVRVEEWVEWVAKVMWESDAVWTGVVGGLADGMRTIPGGQG